MDFFTLLMGSVAVVLGVPFWWLQPKLSVRYNFSIISWPVVLSAIVLLVLPTLLYFAYVSPCRRVETSHYVGMYVALIVIGIPLAIFNIRRTNKVDGCLATVWQVALFAVAMSVGLFPPVFFEMGRPVDGHGKLKYCTPYSGQITPTAPYDA